MADKMKTSSRPWTKGKHKILLRSDKADTSRIDKIRRELSWDSSVSAVTPWILVAGPAQAGKTSFTQLALQLLRGEREGTQKTTDTLAQATPENEPSAGQFNIDFRERAIRDAQDVNDVKDLLGDKADATPKETTFASPSFIVLVLRANVETSSTNYDEMLDIKRSASNLGIPSCLVLTRHGASPQDDKTRADRNILEMNPSRVYLADLTRKRKEERSSRSISKAEEEQYAQYLDALEGIAQDFRESVNNALARAKTYEESHHKEESPETRSPKHPHVDRKGYNTSSSTSSTATTESPQRQTPLEDERCEMCHSFLTNNTAAHVFKVEQRTKYKFQPECIEKFCKMACALLNNPDGGRIRVQLDQRFHEEFKEVIKHKLEKMLPSGTEYEDVCKQGKTKKTQNKDEILFTVKVAEKEDSSLYTYDFKVGLPSEEGLKQATPDEFCELFRQIQREDEFIKGGVLSFHVWENSVRQTIPCTQDDIIKYIERGTAADVTNRFASEVARCICSLAAMREGGVIYLGFSQVKEPIQGTQPLESPPAYQDKDHVSTGKFLVDGIELTEEERRRFRVNLKQEVDSMLCYSKNNRKIEDVSVSFPHVSGGSDDLCLVKISVHYFQGIAWPKGDYPLAFKVIRKGQRSDYEPMTFDEWISSFVRSQNTHVNKDKHSPIATSDGSQKQDHTGVKRFSTNILVPHEFVLSPVPHRDTDTVAKVSEGCIEKFFKIVCALLNTQEGGSICVHLGGSSYELFSQKTGKKLTEMIPTGTAYADNYDCTPAEKHIYFTVKAAGEGGRWLCTYDYRVELPGDVGLYKPTYDQIREIFTNVQEPEKYTPINDPPLKKGALLPSSFGENVFRQMKSCTKEDIVNFAGGGKDGKKRGAHPTDWCKFTRKILRYVRSFATLRGGGVIHLGFSQQKELKKGAQPSGFPPAYKEKDFISTGKFLVDGIELTEDERGRFKEHLKQEVDSMLCYSKNDQKIGDVSVSFPRVSGGSDDLCSVKIEVGYFNGLAWLKNEGPRSYTVVCKGGESDIHEYTFDEWREIIIKDSKNNSES